MIQLQRPPSVYMNGRVTAWDDAKIHVSSEALIRGISVFEGIKGYWRHDRSAFSLLALREHFECLRRSARLQKSVEAVAMDMWEPFKNIVEKELPKADIVHDRFHITGYLTKAVDSVRKGEHRDFMKQGIEVLKGTKHLWLTNRSNWDGEQKLKYRELKGICLKVGRAFSMKETSREFWNYLYKGPAEKFFDRWYFWATHSRLKPMIEAARTLKRHLGNILTYFKHRISNSAAEGLTSKIQLIKADAQGFRNFENFRTAILFHCGGFSYEAAVREFGFRAFVRVCGDSPLMDRELVRRGLEKMAGRPHWEWRWNEWAEMARNRNDRNDRAGRAGSGK